VLPQARFLQPATAPRQCETAPAWELALLSSVSTCPTCCVLRLTDQCADETAAAEVFVQPTGGLKERTELVIDERALT
jgi:hypothetical protein